MILAGGIDKLHLKEPGTHIEYSLLWEELFTLGTNGIDEMGLATSRRSIDKERIEGRFTRMLSNRHSDAPRQLVAVALDEVLEGLVQVETGIEVARHGSIQDCGTLVATGCYRRRVDSS